MLELLLENDANVNCQGLLGFTPLHLAVLSFNVDLVTMVLNYNPHIIQDVLGKDAAMFATRLNQENCNIDKKKDIETIEKIVQRYKLKQHYLNTYPEKTAKLLIDSIDTSL